MIFKIEEVLEEIQRQAEVFGGSRVLGSYDNFSGYIGARDSHVPFSRNTISSFSNKKEICEDSSNITLEQFVSGFIDELIESNFSNIRSRNYEVIKKLVHKTEQYNSLVCEEVFGGEFGICYLLKYDYRPAFFVDKIILKALHMTEEEFLEMAKKKEKCRSCARFTPKSYGLEIKTNGLELMSEVLNKRFLDRIGEKLDFKPFILATSRYGKAVALKCENIKIGLNSCITSEAGNVIEAIRDIVPFTFPIRHVFYFDPRKNYFANIGDKSVAIRDASNIFCSISDRYDENLSFPINYHIRFV